MKQRLDHLVADRGLAESREQAQRLIRAGLVFVDGHPASKPGIKVDEKVAITVRETERFVSRGGHKLEGAFEAFALNVEHRTCLDIGASTGGFTDALLQHGATKVYAIDVGKGQLHWRLRNDPRVVVCEGVNARRLDRDTIPEAASFAVIDVSFISLEKVLPAVVELLEPGAELVTLIKPQFEAGPQDVGKGGVVRDPAVHQRVIDRVRAVGTETTGITWLACVPSPLKGPAGNIEFLAHWMKPGKKDHGTMGT